MSTREMMELTARELRARVPLSADDWSAVLDQVETVRQLLDTLDELPLEQAEPATAYQLEPNSAPEQ